MSDGNTLYCSNRGTNDYQQIKIPGKKASVSTVAS